MALVLVDVDRWIQVTHDYEIFLRADPLTDPDYRVRLEVANGRLEVRCLSTIPAGFWLRPLRGPLYVPVDPYDTNQFRADDLERFETRRRIR